MFKKVTLYTNRLHEMKGFYEYRLGFRVIEANETGFTLAVGESELEFRETERNAFYHFAFNIPGNLFSLAKYWARSHVTLNREAGEDEIYYRNFDADSFYFEDPSGNIVEFIGRRHVDQLGDFTIESILNISEVSITTPYVQEVGQLLQKIGIGIWGNNVIDPSSLNFLGQKDTFILLVPPSRKWYFSKTIGEVHPLRIELADGRRVDVSHEGKAAVRPVSNPVSEGMEELNFSGVVLWKGAEAWASAKGFSNRSEELPNTIDTRFGIASGSKIFTAVAICKLVEEGKLAFSDKLSRLLPELFPNFDVTVHQLLTHTSGIPDYFDETETTDYENLWLERPMYRMESDLDFVPLFSDKALLFPPGERFQYSNAGYIALGVIAEKLTGQTLADTVQKEVFERTKMNRSGYFRLDHLPKHTAIGIIEEGGTWKTNHYAIPIRGGSDGGAFVTAHDMTRFWEGLLNGTLLSEETTARLLTPHVSADNKSYGYGVWIDETKYYVMGRDPGVSFHSGYYPATEGVVTVLSNNSSDAYSVMKLIEERMRNDS